MSRRTTTSNNNGSGSSRRSPSRSYSRSRSPLRNERRSSRGRQDRPYLSNKRSHPSSSSRFHNDRSDSEGGGHKSRRRESSRDVSSRSSTQQRSERSSRGEEKEIVLGDGNGGTLKAKVTEKNGEISCSVDETNRIRISLGLKPLKVSPPQDSKEVSVQKTRLEIANEQRIQELQKSIEQSKKKRELHAKLKGQSLGDLLSSNAKTTVSGSQDALEWIQKSRQLEKEKKLAEERAKLLEEEAKLLGYEAKDLAGIKVAHGAADFQEGEEVILTLKDSRILQEDGNDVADGVDELENVNMSEAYRRKDKEQKEKRARQPVYSGYDDEEFDTPGRERKTMNVLQQYDEEKNDSEGMVLDTTGGLDVERVRRQEAIRAKLFPGLLRKDTDVTSLSMDKLKKADEYFTPEEVAAAAAVPFAKPKKKLRKKAKKRTRDVVAIAQELEMMVDHTTVSSQDQDHGIREEGLKASKSKDLAHAEVNHRQKFEAARQKANDKAAAIQALYQQGTMEDVGVDVDVDVSEGMDDTFDYELGESIARARRLAQMQTDAGADNALRIASAIANRKTCASTVETVEGSSMDVGQEVVFSEATDFDARIRSAIDKRKETLEAQKSTSRLENGESIEKKATIESQVGKEGSEKHEKDDVDNLHIHAEPNKNHEEDGIEESKEEYTEWGQEKSLVAGGMAATLSLLRERGDLRDAGLPRLAGRANDTREKDEDRTIRNGVKLEYKDEFGRNLTKKEAFRQLSYKFHGQKPGKKKQEKKLKQVKEEIEMDKMLSGEGSSKAMKALERRQRAAGKAFVTLSGGTV